MITGIGRRASKASSVARPSMSGIWMSSVTTSGRSESISSSACRPLVRRAGDLHARRAGDVVADQLPDHRRIIHHEDTARLLWPCTIVACRPTARRAVRGN